MHMGIMQSRYQGSFSSAPSRRFVRLMLLFDRRLFCLKALVQSAYPAPLNPPPPHPASHLCE
jgi:hypothetical protein